MQETVAYIPSILCAAHHDSFVAIPTNKETGHASCAHGNFVHRQQWRNSQYQDTLFNSNKRDFTLNRKMQL